MLLSIGISVISASVFLIPSLLVIDRIRIRSLQRTVLYYVMTVYLCVVYCLVGLPTIDYIRWDPGVSWIPLVGIVKDVRSNALNVLLFMPLGVLLPLLWRKYRAFGNTVIFGFLLSLGIEISQLFTFRATDVNDLITNTLGTILGYFVWKTLFGKLSAGSDTSRDDAPLLLGLSSAVMFFAEPFVHGLFNKLI